MATQKIKYFVYCRKSSEDSQRQVASIGDQIKNLNSLVEREGLEVTHKPFTEERSAKDPGRPIFNDVLDRIERGEADGLICWDIDRLSRNPIDNGRLQWMLQKAVIKVIKTPGRSYYPEDAGLLMSIEGGRATDYVMRLSKNVKRGLHGKAMRGWRPSGGPIGYINVGIEKGNKTIDIDPIRFHLVRRMWDLFLTGTYSVRKIRDIATTEWGLRTLQRRKIGGRAPSMSHMYNVFGDPFYYGYFPWKDPETDEITMVQGKHIPMITEAEYWRAQTLLGKKGKPQPKNRHFAFTGLIKCGECGSGVTAEEKNQLICTECKCKFAYENKHACPRCKIAITEMKNPTKLHYVYYHCSKKRGACSQRGIRVEVLEDQVRAEIKKITIDQDYLELAIEYLHDKQKDVGHEEVAARKSLDELYEDCQARLKRLHSEYISPMNANGALYSPEEFATQKKEIIAERDSLEQKRGKVRAGLDTSLAEAERVFNFCAFALKHFNSDDLQKKRAILGTIGADMRLTDKILRVDMLHPFLLIENELKEQHGLSEKLEHAENAPEAIASQGVSAVPPIDLLVGDSGDSNLVRTSKNRSVRTRPGDLDPTSRPLLRG